MRRGRCDGRLTSAASVGTLLPSCLCQGTTAPLLHRALTRALGARPSTSHYAYRDVLGAQIEGTRVSVRVVDQLRSSKPRLREVSGAVDASHVQHARHWVAMVNERAYPGTAKRRRRLKVLVNPKSGTGTGRATWKERALPLIEAAGCELDVTCVSIAAPRPH